MSERKITDVPITKWKEHRMYPSQGTMRNVCARRKDNGAEAFLSMINGRFYVNLERFDEWMSKQTDSKR